MIARLVRSADFERVLRTRTRFSSPHFAVHHVSEGPTAPTGRGRSLAFDQLSTAHASVLTHAVDDKPEELPKGLWWGAVVPKRHARRSVTRTLLKRQIRVAVNGHAGMLAGGLWVVRLRASFDRVQFVSAASASLNETVREELARLLTSAIRDSCPATDRRSR